MYSDERESAQIHTLEGVAASAIILLAVIYAFNAFVVTPTSDVNPGIDTNERVAEDLLTLADNEGEIRNLLLNWNATKAEFKNSSSVAYYYENEDPDPENIELGSDLQSILTDEGLSYNMEASFGASNGSGSMTVVDKGEPGSSAVSASRTVILRNDDVVSSSMGNVTLTEVDEMSNMTYPAPNDGELTYNRLEVRVTVW